MKGNLWFPHLMSVSKEMIEEDREKRIETEFRDDKGRFTAGNPGGPGRPRFSIVSIIREKLGEIPEGFQHTRVEQLVDDYLSNIQEKRDGIAMRDLMDRFDGKPHQTLTVNSEQDEKWLEFLKSVRAESEREAEEDTTGILEGEP